MVNLSIVTMTKWSPDLTGRAGPLYKAIADAMADDRDSGRLAVGTQLPTHRDLAHRLGVTVGTVSRAYAEAERRGLLSGHVGRGTFVQDVAEIPPRTEGPAHASDPTIRPRTPADSGLGAFARYYEEAEAVRGRYNLSLNYPLVSPLADALAGALARVTERATLEAIAGYQPSVGMASHRAAGAAWLRRFGLDSDPERTVVVPGAQGGLLTVFMALTRPGDVVLAETLTWPGLIATAAAMGLTVIPVAMDDAGLDPDALDQACRHHQPRLIYTMPTLHNPRTVVMPEGRRRKIAAVAERHGVHVVEDDVYGFLMDTPLPPIRAFAPTLGLYITSLSKCVAPGLRVGYIDAPEALVAKLSNALRCSTLMTSPVAAELAAETIRSGGAAAAAAAQKAAAQARQRMAAERLSGLPTRAHPNGFHLWMKVPAAYGREAFVSRLGDRGVAVTSGTAFAAGDQPEGEARDHIRLCLGAVPDAGHLAEALDIIADVARVQDHAAMPVV